MKVCNLQGGLHRPLTSPGASHRQLVSECPGKASLSDRGEVKRGTPVRQCMASMTSKVRTHCSSAAL